MKTALNQLENWILDYEKVNGTPTMCEIKAQLEMFKEVERTQIIEAHEDGHDYYDVNGRGADKYFSDTFCQAII